MISLFPRRSILSSCSNWSQKIASQCLLVSFLFFLLFCSLWFNSKIELFVFRVVSRFVRRLVYRIRLKMWILFAAHSLSLCVCFCDRFRFGLWQLWTVCRPITSFFLLNLSISVGCHTQLQHKFHIHTNEICTHIRAKLTISMVSCGFIFIWNAQH